MAYGEQLLSALSGMKVKAADDPFGIAAAGISQGIPGLQNPYASMGSNLMSTVGAGLLSALLAGWAKQDAQKENAQRSLIQGQYFKTTDPTERAALAAKYDYLAPLQSIQFMNDMDIAAKVSEAEKMKAVDLQAAKNMVPIDVDKATQIEQGRVDAQRSALKGTPFEAVAGLPPGLQGDVLQQTQQVAQREGIGNFIDQQFDKALQIPSTGAAISGTTAANEMNGIGISLTTTIQKALGREMNAKEQERLFRALPDWNDTKQQIELKRERFKDLMNTISPATPLADSLRGGSVSMSPTINVGSVTQSPQYTEADLRTAGYTDGDIAAFRAQGVIK